MANLAIIEKGIIRLQGNGGNYRSRSSDEQAMDSEPGIWMLDFQRTKNNDW